MLMAAATTDHTRAAGCARLPPPAQAPAVPSSIVSKRAGEVCLRCPLVPMYAHVCPVQPSLLCSRSCGRQSSRKPTWPACLWTRVTLPPTRCSLRLCPISAHQLHLMPLRCACMIAPAKCGTAARRCGRNSIGAQQSQAAAWLRGGMLEVDTTFCSGAEYAIPRDGALSFQPVPGGAWSVDAECALAPRCALRATSRAAHAATCLCAANRRTSPSCWCSRAKKRCVNHASVCPASA